MVIQDTLTPSLCGEKDDENLFGRANTGALGQVTTKKNFKNGYY